MKGIILLAWVAPVMLLSMGCRFSKNEYVVEMRPTESAVERQLTCRRLSSDTNGVMRAAAFPTKELAEIAKHYRQRSDSTNLSHTFLGVFAGDLPSDLDGWGRFTCLTSSLGNAYVYMERFRGSTNPADLLAARLTAVDQLTDATLGWTKRELGR